MGSREDQSSFSQPRIVTRVSAMNTANITTTKTKTKRVEHRKVHHRHRTDLQCILKQQCGCLLLLALSMAMVMATTKVTFHILFHQPTCYCYFLFVKFSLSSRHPRLADDIRVDISSLYVF